MKRGLVKRPTCPFCGMPIERPRELSTRRPVEMPVGSCSCGAVYACDETGHNLGTAMIEALVFGCNMDWDLAWNLLPGEDYREEIVTQYDYLNHLIVPGGFLESRHISGALFFIRLHEDVQEVTSEGVRKRVEKATPASPQPAPKHSSKKSLSKKEVEELVSEFHLDPILDSAREDKRIIGHLQRLLYSGDDLLRQRAAEALGRVCAVISEADPGAVSRLLQRLFTSIMDTAASAWGGVEAIGEIISRKTEFFAGYLPQLYQFLDDERLRAQALYAIGKIARSRPDLFPKVPTYFIPLLRDTDPSVRGYTAWLLGNLGAHEVKQDLEKLRDDTSGIALYENGELVKKTVGQAASEALEKL
jgi:hypothetical protein